MNGLTPRVLALAGTLIITGCFEDPVTETIAVRFTPEGHIELTHQVKFADTPPGGKNPAFEQRLASLRGDYQREQDSWSLLMASLKPPLERLEWSRNGGTLTSLRHTSSIDRKTLGTVFAALGVGLSMLENEQWEEVSIYGAGPQRATREQRQAVTTALDSWSRALAEYVDATRAVYDYLDENPGRASACMGQLFSRSLSEEERKNLPAVLPAEEPLLIRADEALNACTAILALGEGDAYTLNELSTLVYDPFGADFSVNVPGEILETEGFASRQERTVSRSRASLWTALEKMEDTWLSPDPLVTWIRRDRAGQNDPLPLAGILAKKRLAARAVSALQLRGALEKELSFPPVLRVRWRRPAPGPDQAESDQSD